MIVRVMSMKVSYISLTALLLLLPAYLPANNPTPEAGKLCTSMRIAGYDYPLPAWWDSVEVSVPATLKDWHAVTEFVVKHYDTDTGTAMTWRQALKTWAIASQRLTHFIWPTVTRAVENINGPHKFTLTWTIWLALKPNSKTGTGAIWLIALARPTSS